jgi:hypothetical protein
MTTIAGASDASHAVTLPSAARVVWSRARAYPGDTVKILVRTDHVKDDTAAVLKVQTKEGLAVHTVDGLKITGGKLDHDYELAWKDKTTHGKTEFVVKAELGPAGEVTGTSGVLVVQLAPLGFSA